MKSVYIIAPNKPLAEIPSAITLGEGEKSELVLIVLPGVSASVEMKVDLVGEGASFGLWTAYLCSGSDKVSVSTTVNHLVPGCESRQLVKGIIGGSAKADFYGRIVVAPDAQKTEAYQACHSLLLSENARVNAKPQLEIYADDVKCSHGATVGRLDEEQQFYMRSRGISLDKARLLQMMSFVSEVLAEIPDEKLRETVAEALEKSMASLPA